MSQLDADEESNANRCHHSREWSQQELALLVNLYEGGADFIVLASTFETSVKSIWHRLSGLYFDEPCPESGSNQRNHGKRLELPDDEKLVKLHNEGVSVREMAFDLGRSRQAICVRLLENWWARIPRQTIEKLGLNPEDF